MADKEVPYHKGWYVTWRHVDDSPMSAAIVWFPTREAAEKAQQTMLTRHRADCYTCWREAGMPRGPRTWSDSDVVTRVRTVADVESFAFRNWGDRHN